MSLQLFSFGGVPLRIEAFFSQRAENGGLDPLWLDLAFLGRPDFLSKRSQSPLKKVFLDLWTENRGAPKTRNPTTTDPTPHSRPSDLGLSLEGC